MLTTVLAALLSQNIAVVGHIGITGVIKSRKNSIADNAVTGGIVTILLLLATAVAWVLGKFVLASVSYLSVFVNAVVVILLILAAKLILGKTALAEKVDFIAATVAVLILALASNAAASDIGTALLTAVASGAGYTLVSIVYSTLCEKLDNKSIPKAFRGLPIQLLTAGMIALAFVCF